MNGHHEDGFTLIEMLIVLAVWSVILLLVAPMPLPVLEKQTEKHFLETLQMDLLYTQSLSYNDADTTYSLTFPDDHHYVIKDVTFASSGEIVVTRTVPDGWNVQPRTLPAISFNERGTIRKSGTFSIQTSSSTYNIVCPLGKGRCYIAEK
ncbi:comG operon protein ComGD [Lentibacillus halophilus]|uniref:ComG operon protein ComGD n=1 Tax=Lentibacillus halophilus TaxID=295065 RepID=A0ABN0ZCM9_9BACI